MQGRDLVRQLRTQLEMFFDGKIKALEELANKAAEAQDAYVESNKDDGHYYKGKNLTGMDLKFDPNFGVEVNKSASIVHVPTEVYDKGSEVVADIKWTKSLNKVFESNFKKFPGLSWQYFGTAEGIHRQYPGRVWPAPPPGVPDMYDCRRRPWYIQGATSPKDVIILIDVSGSLEGIRIEIARLAAEKIVETLTTNDFFHVVTFNNESKLICCDSNKKLMQATRNNKEYVKTFLRELVPANTANWANATEMALEMLNDTKARGEGSRCQQILIVLSDGSAKYEKEIFTKYDPEGMIRVFTYVVGPAQYDTSEMREMACSHKGYFSRTAIVGAVWDAVTTYIRVMSRPVGLAHNKPVTFTSVFVDATGSGLVSTGSIPVFKKSDPTDLLGVMATDIPVKDLSEYIYFPLIGHNGYIFVIDNNGLVLIHPGINEKKLARLSPQPNMDFEELEFAVYNQSLIQQMRTVLIQEDSNDEIKSLKLEAFRKSSNELRLHKDIMEYYYVRSSKTAFSIGLASPKFGFKVARTVNLTQGIKYLQNVTRLKSWPYCKKMRKDKNHKAKLIEKLRQAAKDNLFEPEEFNCERSMINGLLADAKATHDLVDIWHNTSPNLTQGIFHVHARTHWGVIRSKSFCNESLPRVERVSKSKEEDLSVSPWGFYGRSVRTPSILTVSVFLRRDLENSESEGYEPRITLHYPLNYKRLNSELVLAVMGVEMNYTRFMDDFFIGIAKCKEDDVACDKRLDCNRDGQHQMQGLYCYLLDENGFIIASNEPIDDTGRFFGEVDSLVMAKLSQSNRTHSLYDIVILPDYQERCKLYPTSDSSDASFLTGGIKSFVLLITSSLQSTILLMTKLLVQMLATSFWNGKEVEAREAFVYVNCMKNTTFYLARPVQQPFITNAKCHSSGECLRNVSVVPVNGTNLHFVTVESNCGKCKEFRETDLPGIPGTSKEKIFRDGAHIKPPQREKVRRNPSKCYGPSVEKNRKCGRGTELKASIFLIIFLFITLFVR